MRKLMAIWQILFSDKWAVFTFEEAAPDPTWLKVPNFFWNISHKDKVFFWAVVADATWGVTWGVQALEAGVREEV